ncbi:MAG: lytic transglycosylase domain-containing protein [Pyrinomonadaceae bacterium]
MLIFSKKFPLLLIISLFFVAHSALAQQSGYRYDNFDAATGIKIEVPKANAVLPPSKTVRRTAKRVSAISNAHAQTLPLVYVRPSMGMSAGKSLDGFTTGNELIDSYIAESGKRNGVDPVLLYSIMHQESSFKAGAVSYKGARGLMQLMPATAARFGVTRIFDPRQNIEGGARYMRFLLDTFGGDVQLALAGYNAGEGAVIKYGGVPPYSETREYVRRIGRRYALMRDPETAANALRLNSTQVAMTQNQQSAPLNIYERTVYAVRLPDGRLQLVSR